MSRLRSWMMAVLALMLIHAPAHAGLRAIYFDPGKSKQLVIEVADNGDARIGEAGKEEYGLLIGGHFFIVGRNDGELQVARIEDVAAAVDQVVPPIFKDIFSKAMAKDPRAKGLKVEVAGERTIGGRTGNVYKVYGLNDSNPDEPTEFVMSDDPALKPIGATMEQFMNAAIVPAAALIGPAVKDLIVQTRAIFALGTPIDAGGRFRLDRIDPLDVPPARLKLPAVPLSVEALVKAMRAGSLAGKP